MKQGTMNAKFIFRAMIPGFRKTIAVSKVPHLHPPVCLVKATCG
jgi:hypothetical protein